jgi:peptidase M23-like protein
MSEHYEPDIGLVRIHSPIADRFVSSEHAEGELTHLGDALGVDCTVVRHDGAWVRSYEHDGRRNEDWYSWRYPLLAPFDGVVVAVRENPVTNMPGALGQPPASSVTFARADSVHVVLAHVQEVRFAVGDTVTEGQEFALIGNNGMAWHPHVHIGAWRDETPLQIRIDLRSLGRARRERAGSE